MMNEAVNDNMGLLKNGENKDSARDCLPTRPPKKAWNHLALESI